MPISKNGICLYRASSFPVRAVCILAVLGSVLLVACTTTETGPDISKVNAQEPVAGRWSQERINAWYDDLPWLVGCNYYPATAINQIDMWQEATFDSATIEKELDLAASIGMNTLRVYLHDLVWAEDPEGLYSRMDQFLDICADRGIRPSFVFFDDCHFPNPRLGPQPLPIARFHNSGWVNSPARDLAIRFAKGRATEQEGARLKGYVQGTISRFKEDPRVLYWELYNEPGRGRGESLETAVGDGSDTGMGDTSSKLVYASWIWAREINPFQPITSNSEGSVGALNIAINRLNSDFHSIHSYSPPDIMQQTIEQYLVDGRPVVMTEWLARTRGSTVQGCLPILRAMNVGAINWGFVSGETGTIWPWSSRIRTDEQGNRLSAEDLRAQGEVIRYGEPLPEPELWFHDLFRPDYSPYDRVEIDIFKNLTGGRSNGFDRQ